MDLCKYKNIFGKPGEGIHRYRIHDIAIVDTVMTIVVAYLIKEYFKQPFLKVLIILFIIGIISHRLFCVKTTVDKIIFGA